MITENKDYILIKNRFPHIAKSIEICWGSGELTLYLNNLFHDTRDGKRQGFPRDIAKALWQILDLHTKEFPETNKLSSRNDPFHTNWDR